MNLLRFELQADKVLRNDRADSKIILGKDSKNTRSVANRFHSQSKPSLACIPTLNIERI